MDVGKEEHLLLLREYIAAIVLKSLWRFLNELAIYLPHDPALPLLGLLTKGSMVFCRDICSHMFVIALFTIART